MWRFLLKRLLLMVPTLLGVTLVCFLILRIANADPVSQASDLGLNDRQISREALEHLRRLYSLDQPWYVQYWRLLRRLVTLDLGNRWQDGRAIKEVIGEALPITLLLSFTSLTFSYLIAIPLGVFSAARRGTRLDAAATLVLFLLYSLPSFWVGTMLLVFLGSGRFVRCPWIEGGGCFPLQGWQAFGDGARTSFLSHCLDVWWHVTLPVVTLTYGSLASLSRYMRSGMLDTMKQDFIRTAWAKGLSEGRVLFVHALRNGIIPIITLLGLTLPYLISGSVVVEQIFGIRGMGLVALEAIRLPDYPLVITVVAFTSVVTMVGILISDVVYALVDPRIRVAGDRDA
jgi:peptide/nickel transport system permease protein